MLVEIIILINVFLIFNVFILYPVILFVASKLFSKPINKKENFEPDITVVIAAYNEEKLIKGAIDSIFKSNYPTGKIKVLVGSDGSNDGTIRILNTLKEQYLSLDFYEFARVGKNAVLNYLVDKSNTEIIFYMDADLRVKPDTIAKMIAILSDNSVGAVLASLEIVGEKSVSTAGGFGESLYQKYETFMRKKESDIYSNINSLGTLYGIKMEVYSPIPNDFVCDDLYRMLKTASHKKRIIFNTDLVVEEVREKTTKEEMLRRIRLVAGGLSTVKECKSILNPKYGWVSFFVWEHKVLRWLSPLYLIMIAVSIIFLRPESYLFIPILSLQTALYGGALIGWLFEKFKLNIIPFRILLFAVSMNIGFLLGLFRFLAKGQNAIWGRNVNN
ncbi:MAG: glycosyltransferase [bacterium]